jgi:hypothetical protein
MDSARAREVLKLYRPGTMDAMNPEMAEALRVAHEDPELARWFDEHCGVYIAIRSKLKQIEVPADLKHRILADQLGRKRVTHFPRALIWLAAAAAVALAAVGVWKFSKPAPVPPNFAMYREFAARDIQRGYAPKLFSTNSAAISDYLRGKDCPADYDLPNPVEKLPPIGCADLDWRGRKYSMLCYATAGSGAGNLWLFVARCSDFDPKSLPAGGSLKFAPVLQLNTLSWVDGDKVYVLAKAGTDSELQQYFGNN